MKFIISLVPCVWKLRDIPITGREKVEGIYPWSAAGLSYSSWTLTAAKVTCGHRQVQLDLGTSERANIQFLQQPDSVPGVHWGCTLVTLWHPLTDGTPCRCSQHLPFGKVSEREVLPGPGTLEHPVQHEAGWALPHPLPCICLVF